MPGSGPSVAAVSARFALRWALSQQFPSLRRTAHDHGTKRRDRGYHCLGRATGVPRSSLEACMANFELTTSNSRRTLVFRSLVGRSRLAGTHESAHESPVDLSSHGLRIKT